jgi:hypothetical protein
MIASLFGHLQGHQRPSSGDACDAMARIKFLVQLMQQARTGLQDLPPGFISKSLTVRCLASLYFPSNLATWTELINQAVFDGLEALLVTEIDRLVGGDLIGYLDQQVDINVSIQNAIERDFQFSLNAITTRVIEAFQLDWLTPPQNSNPDLIWPVIYQWVSGEEAIVIPSSVNCHRIDWKQITELNGRVIESINTTQAKNASADSEPFSPVNLTQPSSDNTPVAEKSKNSIQVPATLTQGSGPSNPPPASSSTQKNRTEQSQKSTYDTPLSNQYEQTIKATELFSDASQSGKKSLKSNSQGCDIRSANDPQLAKLLEQLIDDCRAAQGMLSLLRIRAVSNETGEVIQNGVSKLLEWQAIAYKTLKLSCTSPFGAAFLNSDGDFSIVFQDLDRIQTSRLVRSTILPQEFNVAKSSRTSERCGIVCGVATVSRPSRAFLFDQLAEAAERCLQGAMLQGCGSIKSLEVF